MSTQRTLRSFFEKAKHDVAPLSSEAVRSIVAAADPAPSGIASMPLLTGAAAALATVIGITGYLVSTDQEPNRPLPTPPSTTSTLLSAQQPTVGATADTNGGTAERVIRRSITEPADGIVLLSMKANDLEALDIHSDAIAELRAAITESDSMGACARGTICVWENGKRREVTFGSKDAPFPAMVTTPDGKGRSITIPSIRELDVNDLIPMETTTNDGKIVMWFPPTERIITQLPPDVANGIRIVPLDDAPAIRTFRFDMNDEDVDLDMDVDIPNIVNIDSLMRTITTSLGGLDSVMVSNLCRTPIPDSLLTKLRNGDLGAMEDHLQQRITIRTMNMNRRVPDRLDSTDRTPRTVTSNIIIIRRSKGTEREVSSGDQRLQETRSSDGAVEITSVYPNPTSDGAATISYTLADDRVLTVDLMDLGGRKVATLATGLRKARGTGQIAFTLSGIPAGMYLVNVTTDKGERTVQRLVVQ